MLTSRQRGVTLVELLIGLAVIAILMVIGLPSYNSFIRNGKVKATAQAIEQGLQLARAEAIKRNANVRFTFVSNLGSSCAAGGSSWVVSLDNPVGKCNVAPSDTTDPRIIQKWDSSESVTGLPLTVGQASFTNTITFNGVGRVTPAFSSSGSSPNLGQIYIDTSGGEYTCTYVDEDVGTIRCMRIQVTNAGQIRICDPKVAASTDPRKCS